MYKQTGKYKFQVWKSKELKEGAYMISPFK